LKIIVICLLLAVPAAIALRLPSAVLETVIKTPPMPAPKPAFEPVYTQPLQINGVTPLCIGGTTPGGKPGTCRNDRPVGAPMGNEPVPWSRSR
jgi:hypothetical protein